MGNTYEKFRKSTGVAILLCLLFGGLWLHRFYVKKYTRGLLYLLFCWTFIPTVLSVIDLFLIGRTVAKYNDELQNVLDPNTSR